MHVDGIRLTLAVDLEEEDPPQPNFVYERLMFCKDILFMQVFLYYFS